MTKYFDSFYMIDDKDVILGKCEEITDLLKNAYWAKDREYDIVLEKHKNQTRNSKYAHKYPACLFGRNIRTYLRTAG